MSSLNHAQGQLLAQVQPAVTTPVVLFQAGELRTEVTLVFTCNHDAGNVTIEFFHDDAGTTFDHAHKLSQVQLAPNDPDKFFQSQHPGSGIMISPGGALGIKVSAINAVTVTVYGITETLAERVRGLS